MLSRLPDLERLLRRARPGNSGHARFGRRQVYILPTARGWLFGMLLVALLFTGINYGNNLILALTFLLAGIGHAALLQTWRNLAGLEIRVHPADPVFAGETALFPVTLVSADTRRDALKLSFHRQRTALGGVGKGDALSRVDVPWATARRGVLRPGTLRVATEFPLGMFRAWGLVEPAISSLVYPAPVSGTPLPEGGTGEGGGTRSGHSGSEDFAGLRPYRIGDAFHRISWKTSARSEDLQVKEFDGEAATVRWIDWDRVPFREPEQRLGVLTAWVVEAEGTGQVWGLRLPGIRVDPDSGSRHRERCLALLARHGDPS